MFSGHSWACWRVLSIPVWLPCFVRNTQIDLVKTLTMCSELVYTLRDGEASRLLPLAKQLGKCSRGPFRQPLSLTLMAATVFRAGDGPLSSIVSPTMGEDTLIRAGVMTCSIALFGPVLYPDWPERPNYWSFWLTKTDKEIALERRERCGRRSPNPINWRAVKKALLNPVTWHLACIYSGMLIAPLGTSCKWRTGW